MRLVSTILGTFLFGALACSVCASHAESALEWSAKVGLALLFVGCTALLAGDAVDALLRE